jgi:glucokinase
MVSSGKPALLHQINQSAILDRIRSQGPLSRIDLARQLHLSQASVTRIVQKLLEDNLVIEVAQGASPLGRKPILLQFNYQASRIIGIDLGGTKIAGALADLEGNLIEQRHIPAKADARHSTLDKLLTVVAELVDAARPRGAPGKRDVRGIGIGVPGVVREDGAVVFAPAFDWRNLLLAQIVREKFGIPTFVENDANLSALGEYWFGAGKGQRNLMCVMVGTGIGAGLIVDGQLYRGRTFSAGEIGYITTDQSQLGQRYDRFGPLEMQASGLAIADRARAALAGERQGVMPNLVKGKLTALTAKQVCEAARRGDTTARRIVAEAIDALAMALNNVISLFDPDIVILNGGVMRSADLFLEPIRQRLQGVIPDLPPIVVSSLGGHAIVKGAIAHAIHGTDEFVFVSH